MVAYHWQNGVTLRSRANEGELCKSDLEATAESLAGFHASGRQGLSPVNLQHQSARLHALAAQLGILLPGLRHRASTLAVNLARWREDQQQVFQPVHGDFYDKQAVVDNGKVSLIDLDAARLGNPLTDLGSYVAHLERLALNHGISAADVETQKETLVSAYEQLTGGICLDQLDKYIAMNLFVLIHHPFRDWAPDWPTQTRRLLERVESLYGS